jgi:hypothetical protein
MASDLTWIYLMKDHRSGFYKIGRSNQPCFREKTLQAEVPLVDLVEAWRANSNEERKLHVAFDGVRLRGEWFHLTDDHVEVIAEYFAGHERLIAKIPLNEERDRIRREMEESRRERLLEMENAHEALAVEDLGYNGAMFDFAFEGLGIEF